MTEKRRCSPGYTHDPYPCCGTDGGPYGRQKNCICRDCSALIEEGKRARGLLNAAAPEVRTWTERDWGFPGYYGDWEWPHALHHGGLDLHHNLRAAIFKMVNAVVQPAPGDTPSSVPTKKSTDYTPWPNFLSQKENGTCYDWRILVTVDPSVRAAIDAVDQAIRAALGGVYLEGKERGSASLLQLATGEMSMTDFEEAIKPRKER